MTRNYFTNFDDSSEDFTLGKTERDKLKSTMKRRRRFDFSVCDFMYSCLCPIKRHYPCFRKDGKSVQQNYIKFQKGLRKLNVDMDLTTILTSIRRMRFLTDAMMTQDQQFIEKYSMSNLIDYSHEQDLQDMNSIPTVNVDKSHQDVLIHESEVDHKLDFLSSRPLESMDKFLICQVS